MTAFLLDSDVVIELLRARNKAIQSTWAATVGSEILVLYSPVTTAEIEHGLRDHERPAVDAWFAALTCVPIDAVIGVKAGAYLRQFEKSHGLELGDALIAATAAVHNLQLWTRNKKHYPMRDIKLH
jgi:predicted nucleic acid-binding protein